MKKIINYCIISLFLIIQLLQSTNIYAAEENNVIIYDSVEAASPIIKQNILNRVVENNSNNDFYFALMWKYPKANFNTIYDIDVSIFTTTIYNYLYQNTGQYMEGDALYTSIEDINYMFQISYSDANDYGIIKCTVYGHLRLLKQHSDSVINWVVSNTPAICATSPTMADKAKAIFTYIVNNVSYGNLNLDNKEVGYTAYGAINGAAVCEGIAQLYYNMALAAGIPCRIVVDNNHAWNIVQIDGIWYIVDATTGISMRNNLEKALNNACLIGSSNYNRYAGRDRSAVGGPIEVSPTNYTIIEESSTQASTEPPTESETTVEKTTTQEPITQEPTTQEQTTQETTTQPSTTQTPTTTQETTTEKETTKETSTSQESSLTITNSESESTTTQKESSTQRETTQVESSVDNSTQSTFDSSTEVETETTQQQKESTTQQETTTKSSEQLTTNSSSETQTTSIELTTIKEETTLDNITTEEVSSGKLNDPIEVTIKTSKEQETINDTTTTGTITIQSQEVKSINDETFDDLLEEMQNDEDQTNIHIVIILSIIGGFVLISIILVVVIDKLKNKDHGRKIND